MLIGNGRERQRKILMDANSKKITQHNREIDYKQNQLNTKIVTEKHDSFVDGKKPLFYLQNDIEDIKAEIKELEFSNLRLKEEYDKDAAEEKKERLTRALDGIDARWGEFTVVPARMLGMEQKVQDRIAFGGMRGRIPTS